MIAFWQKKLRRRHLNFRQISHRFTSSFTNPSFQDLNGSHIMYWNMMILNPSRFKVEPHSKYWYFCIELVDLLSLLFSENAVLFHIQWPCRKTTGNVNRPPYRYTGVTHWALLAPLLSGDERAPPTLGHVTRGKEKPKYLHNKRHWIHPNLNGLGLRGDTFIHIIGCVYHNHGYNVYLLIYNTTM